MKNFLGLVLLFSCVTATALQWKPNPPKIPNAFVGYTYRTCLAKLVATNDKAPLRFTVRHLPKWVTFEEGCFKGRPTYEDYGGTRLELKVSQGEKSSVTHAYLFVFDGGDE